MKSSHTRFAGFLALTLFLLVGLTASATRPGADEVARHRCNSVVWELFQNIERLSAAQFEEMMGRRSGVQPIDHRVLSYLLAHDPDSEGNDLYDLIMEVEKGYSHCHYYCVFNMDQTASSPYLNFSFATLDNVHGFQRDFRDNRYMSMGPRQLFKEICRVCGTEQEYEKYAADFQDETEEGRKLKKAQERNSPYMAGLAKYWQAILFLMVLDFFFIDMRYLKGQKEGLKLYCFGLHLVSSMLVLSFITIHYTGTPIPDLKSFSHLVRGAYPEELHFLSDVILTTSFAWWGISILATFIAGEEKGLAYLAALYVIVAPLGLAMSESLFIGGMEKLALPIFGLAIMLINALYVKSKAPATDTNTEKPD